MKTIKDIISEAVKKYFKENTNYVPGDKTKTIENDKLVDMFEDTSSYIKKRKKDEFTPPQPPSINPDEIIQVEEDGEVAAPTTTDAIAMPTLPIALTKRKYNSKLRDGTYVFDTNEEEFKTYKGLHTPGKRWNEYIDENSELGAGVKYYSRFGNVAIKNPISKGIVYVHKR